MYNRVLCAGKGKSLAIRVYLKELVELTMIVGETTLIRYLEQKCEEAPELGEAVASRSPEKVMSLFAGDEEFEGLLDVAAALHSGTGSLLRQRRQALHATLGELLRRQERKLSKTAG